MNRSALLLAVLLSVSACGGTEEGPATESEPTLAADRFQTLWTDTTDLVNGIDPEAEPGNADEANEAAGLDQDSPLRFVDMGTEPNGGRWCMESDEETYVALTYGNGESAILMGDGACDYDVAAAEVVGDFMTAEWTRGEELMGDVGADPDA